jgi:glycosyltransferase involved in cell wall biosynthesis
MIRPPKIAIVHEWFVDYSGSEKVVEQFIKVFPDSKLFALIEFLPPTLKHFINNKNVETSFIQHLPFAKKKYRNYLALMPLAVEQLDVSAADIVISSSHAVSKGVLTNSSQLSICYCHSPVRYAWDLYHQYLKETNLNKGIKGFLAKIILHYIRNWDLNTSNRVDYFIANSQYVARRIKKIYNREATVIYPPVNIDKFSLCVQKEDFYLTSSRLVPYKKLDIIISAFSKLPNKRLIVIGEGPDYKKLRKMATKNVQILGYQTFEILKGYMQKAKAFIFAADEDFGITPVEAQACGTPVIAYKKGGCLETILEFETGLFFKEQTTESVLEAIHIFEERKDGFIPSNIRKHAEKFSEGRFRTEIQNFVLEKYQLFLNNS